VAVVILPEFLKTTNRGSAVDLTKMDENGNDVKKK
jgi:hypothetical protein